MGIVGANGSGKSNIAAALTSAFTGVFKHVDGTQGCRTQNYEGTTYISVEGQLDNNPFGIIREITPKTIKHSLFINDKLVTNKTSDIESWITSVSGITPAIMMEFIFIKQQEMYAFIEAANAERAHKFSALCGTLVYEGKRDWYASAMKADKIRMEAVKGVRLDTLKEALTNDMLQLTKYINEPDTPIQDVAVYEKELQTYEETVYQPLLQVAKMLDTVQSLIPVRNTLQKEINDCIEQEQATRQAQQEIDLRKTAIENDPRAINLGASGSSAAYAAKQETILKNLITLLDYEQMHPDQFDQDKAIAFAKSVTANYYGEVKNQPAEPVDYARMFPAINLWHWTATRDNNLAAIGRLKAEIEDLKKLLKIHAASDADGTCTCCGANIQHWTRSAKDIAAAIRDNETALRDAQVQHNNLSSLVSMWQIYESKHQYLIQEAGTYYPCEEKELLQEQIAENLVLVTAMEKEINDLNALTSANNATLNTLQRNRLTQQTKLDQTKTTILLHLNQLEIEEDAIPDTIQSTAAMTAEAKERIAELNDAIKQAAAYKAGCDVLNQRIADRKKEIAFVENALADGEVSEEWLQKFEKALQWLKPDGVPRIIHHNVLQQLLQTINNEIRVFDTDFHITLNADLTFTANFDDGRKIHAKGLSGGQKVILSLAFWSAINQTFARNLGIMILDEPTDGLDETNSYKLRSILQTWNDRVTARGQQIIIITHDTNLQPAFQSVLNLS
jgi:DNA repair exonuclease SbcCD ATPase subunit